MRVRSLASVPILWAIAGATVMVIAARLSAMRFMIPLLDLAPPLVKPRRLGRKVSWRPWLVKSRHRQVTHLGYLVNADGLAWFCGWNYFFCRACHHCLSE